MKKAMPRLSGQHQKGPGHVRLKRYLHDISHFLIFSMGHKCVVYLNLHVDIFTEDSRIAYMTVGT